MMCEAPTARGVLHTRQDNSGREADSEHDLLHQVLDVVDWAFYDQRNDDGAAASAATHTYHGVDMGRLRTALDARSFKTRDATYREITKIVKKLGDKYSRFLPESEARELQKYDVSGVGLVLIREGEGLYVSTSPFPASPSARAGVARADRVVALLRGGERGMDAQEVRLDGLSANDAAAAINAEARDGPVHLRLRRSKAEAGMGGLTGARGEEEIVVRIESAASTDDRWGQVLGGWAPKKRAGGTVTAQLVERGGSGGLAEIIKISKFEATTANEVDDALRLCDHNPVGSEQEAGKDGKCSLIALDLRGNRGMMYIDKWIYTYICMTPTLVCVSGHRRLARGCCASSWAAD